MLHRETRAQEGSGVALKTPPARVSGRIESGVRLALNFRASISPR
jgi:hypothetical protein